MSPNLRQRLVALSGEDKPGIMHAVSSFFADKGINILSMNVYNGAHSYTVEGPCLALTLTHTTHTPPHARTHTTQSRRRSRVRVCSSCRRWSKCRRG